jgi:hypothetical protein
MKKLWPEFIVCMIFLGVTLVFFQIGLSQIPDDAPKYISSFAKAGYYGYMSFLWVLILISRKGNKNE